MKIKKLLYSALSISMFSSFIMETSVNVHADTWGDMPKWVLKAGKQGVKDNEKNVKELKKQSKEFYKTHDKNIEYDLDGSISNDPNNVAVAKKYKKELPKLEKKLKNTKQGTKDYNSLNCKVQMHKTVIKAIFG